MHRARGADGVVYIEWTMRFPLGGAVVDVSQPIDRFLLARRSWVRNGPCIFDQLPLIAGVLRHPTEWAGYLRYRFGS